MRTVFPFKAQAFFPYILALAVMFSTCVSWNGPASADGGPVPDPAPVTVEEAPAPAPSEQPSWAPAKFGAPVTDPGDAPTWYTSTTAGFSQADAWTGFSQFEKHEKTFRVSARVDFDPDVDVSAAIGRFLNRFASVELEGAWSRAGSDSVSAAFSFPYKDERRGGSITFPGVALDVESVKLLLNGRAFYPVQAFGREITPYLIAGGGVAHVSADLSAGDRKIGDDEDWTFVAQTGAGALYPVTDAVDLEVTGRYSSTIGLENVAFQEESEFDAWTVRVGIFKTW